MAGNNRLERIGDDDRDAPVNGRMQTEVSLQRMMAGVVPLLFVCLLVVPCLGQQPDTPGAPAKTSSVTSGADTSSAKEKPAAIDLIDQARAALAKAESERPVDPEKVVNALCLLAQRQSLARRITQETIDLAQRAMSVAEAARGRESLLYAEALSRLAQVYTYQDHAEQARPLSEQALEIAQRTGPGTLELAMVADGLNRVCLSLNDISCSLRAAKQSVEAVRASHTADPLYLASLLQNQAQIQMTLKDTQGARKAMEESIAICDRETKVTPSMAVMESNASSFYLQMNEQQSALQHLEKAKAYTLTQYGADSVQAGRVSLNLASLYSRSGRIGEALTEYERAYAEFGRWYGPSHTETIRIEGAYAETLASVGHMEEALQMANRAHEALREHLSLAIRVLPERQALALTEFGNHMMDIVLSIELRNPGLETDAVFQEEIRSRSLVTEEMAQRAASLNRSSDPEIAALLLELEKERSAVLAAHETSPGAANSIEQLPEATSRMERIERTLAERSVAFRANQRTRSVALDDVHHQLPTNSVLVSYVAFHRDSFDAKRNINLDPLWYMAFVLHPDSNKIDLFDLGEGKGIDALVFKARAAAESEAHDYGLASIRNERAYREAAGALRKRIWDPLKADVAGAKLALVVADGTLNLIPFSSLPDGKGYMVEHGPVIHMLTSERDLVPDGQPEKKHGLLAIGSPAFDHIPADSSVSALRGGPVSCDAFRKVEFQPLPGTAVEVTDVGSSWRRWNSREPALLITGENATRGRFLDEAAQSRVLHIATHAFLLDKSCGNGNPLLHSGLVFAGGKHGEPSTILTAQQIASLDLSGADWAVLSACNTGNGELRDGEGVLSLQRAFRVAGVRSVVMTLWPVDDETAREFMHDLYTERLGHHSPTANALWDSARKMLLSRRAAGKSTHPWYWAGFVGSGGWE